MTSFKGIIIGTAGIPATCTITSDNASFTDATPFEIQVVFDKSVTGFVIGDITITKATLSNFAGSGTSYTADVTPDLSGGDIVISIDADVTTEGNSASNTVTVTDAVVATEQGWYDSATFTTDISGAVIENKTAGNLNETIRSVVKYPADGSLRYAEGTISRTTAGTSVYSPIGFSYDEGGHYLGGVANEIGLWNQATFSGGGGTTHSAFAIVKDDVIGLFCKGLDVWIYHVRLDIYVGGGDPYTGTSPTFTFNSGSDIYIAGNAYAKENRLTINTVGSFSNTLSSPAVAWDS